MCLLNYLRKSKKKIKKQRNIEEGFDDQYTNNEAVINSTTVSSPRLDKLDYRAACEYRLNGDISRSRLLSDKEGQTCNTRSSSDSGVGINSSSTSENKRNVGNFIVKSHCDSDSDDSISAYGDADHDNWHGIDLTRRGRTAKKKSSLQDKLKKRNSLVSQMPKKQTSGDSRIMLPSSRKSSIGCRTPSVRSGRSDTIDYSTVKRSQHSSCKSIKSVTTCDASDFRRSTKQRSRRPSMLTALPYDSINPNLYT